MDIYELLRQEMTKPVYAPLVSALYDGKPPAVWPDSGTEPASRGNYDGKEAEDGSDSKGASIVTGSGMSEEEDEKGKPEPATPAQKDPSGRVVQSFEGRDRKGDAKPGFMDIVQASVQVREDGAILRIELASLPEELPFDSAVLQTGEVEYEWSFDLDLDSDGNTEFSIGLSSFKAENRKPETTAILARCHAQVWKTEGDSASSVRVPLKVAVDGAAIVFTLNDSPELPLASFAEDSFITARTYWDSGKESSSDSMDL
jgi:hypothetical protein